MCFVTNVDGTRCIESEYGLIRHDMFYLNMFIFFVYYMRALTRVLWGRDTTI